MSEFDDCQRRWAYHYCWYDFDYFEFPDPLKRECQFHSKLMGQEAFAGQVVHDVIDELLRSRIEGRLPFYDQGSEAISDVIDAAVNRAKEIAREYVQTSRDFIKAYQSGEKPPRMHRQPLYRIFFDLGWDGSAKAEFRKSVESALMHFLDSDLYASLQSEDPVYYEMPPQGGAPWFLDRNVPVYANYDFALRKPEQTTLFDWKTGKVNQWAERDVTDQLHTYAAYAMEKWRTPPEEIKLVAVWLSLGKDKTHEIGVDMNRLERLRQEWRERHRLLSRRREEAKGDVEKLFEIFPMTGIEKNRCRTCNYRFCEGYRTSTEGPGPEGEPSEKK